MKKIIQAIRSYRLFRPMTFEEAKRLCMALSKPLVREHERIMKVSLGHDDDRAVALHLIRMARYSWLLRLSHSSLLLHFRLLVGSKNERADIVTGCFDANFELLFKLRSDSDTKPSGSKAPIH